MDLWRHCLPFSLVTFLAFKLVAPLMMMSFLKKMEQTRPLFINSIHNAKTNIAQIFL